MKKLLSLFILFVLSLILIACNAKNPSQSNNVNTSADIKITYTKELAYLPSYNGVESTEFIPATTAAPLAKATYIIKNTRDIKVYEDYESILKKDNWIITEEKKYINFSAKKDSHVANISIAVSSKEDVILIVQSK